jgi:hypothetical protein
MADRRKFRVLVTSETARTKRGKKKTLYVAIALEWHMAAQGDTVSSALDSIERLLVTQVGLLGLPQFCTNEPPKPAPRDYHRAWRTGRFICTDPTWSIVCPPSIVHARKVIDTAMSRYVFRSDPRHS